MPFVRICVTGDEERPTSEQKKELIAGVTKLVGDVLGKNTSNMVVIIDEIPMETMESEVRPSENAAKKNKANDQKKNRTGRKTDSVLLHPMCRITLSSSGRVQAEQSLPGRHV